MDLRHDTMIEAVLEQPIATGATDPGRIFELALQIERAVFGAATWQRCRFHSAQNAVHHAPDRDIENRIGKQLRAVRNASSPQTARAEPDALAASHRGKHSDLADQLETDIPEGLAVFSLPEAHRKRMRTSNGIERPIRQEPKRRTVKVRVFPNLDSLLRLSTAVPVEIDEKRETETKAYIKWEGLDE